MKHHSLHNEGGRLRRDCTGGEINHRLTKTGFAHIACELAMGDYSPSGKNVFPRIESLHTHARLDVAPFELEVLLRLVRGVPRAAVLARLQAPCALPDELGLRVVSLLVKLRLARERLGLVRVRLRVRGRLRLRLRGGVSSLLCWRSPPCRGAAWPTA